VDGRRERGKHVTAKSGARDVKTLYPDEAKEFIDQHAEGSYVLLDVRQPVEYEQGHLPGAELIPLPLLPDSLGRLDRERPVLVYCAVGGRSATAALFLAHNGFSEVYQLEGGLDAWEQPTPANPVGFHLEFASGRESPREAVALAYAMEQGMLDFHEAVRARTEEPELSALLVKLVRAEESHKRTLLDLLRQVAPDESLPDDAAKGPSRIMEGGIDIHDFMKRNESFMKTTAGYLDIAMMVESQALDLYLSIGKASDNEATRRILFHIADEEKTHLSMLAKLLEKKMSEMPLL
jgi:sulfur-carrier protein adenylyltransferase/sulfurtransferase